MSIDVDQLLRRVGVFDHHMVPATRAAIAAVENAPVAQLQSLAGGIVSQDPMIRAVALFASLKAEELNAAAGIPVAYEVGPGPEPTPEDLARLAALDQFFADEAKKQRPPEKEAAP